MRAYLCIAAEAIVVSAAHSRIISPGDVVDFDEIVRPRDGGFYSLETALGPADAAKFEEVKDWPALAAEAEVGLATFFDETSEVGAEEPVLRTDGPTIEGWVEHGYQAENYPPEGYAELPSDGLTRFRETGKVFEVPASEPVSAEEPTPMAELMELQSPTADAADVAVESAPSVGAEVPVGTAAAESTSLEQPLTEVVLDPSVGSDVTPGVVEIASLNADKAKALIQGTLVLESLEAIAQSEGRRDGGPRVSVMRAIEHRRTELKG